VSRQYCYFYFCLDVGWFCSLLILFTNLLEKGRVFIDHGRNLMFLFQNFNLRITLFIFFIFIVPTRRGDTTTTTLMRMRMSMRHQTIIKIKQRITQGRKRIVIGTGTRRHTTVIVMARRSVLSGGGRGRVLLLFRRKRTRRTFHSFQCCRNLIDHRGLFQDTILLFLWLWLWLRLAIFVRSTFLILISIHDSRR